MSFVFAPYCSTCRHRQLLGVSRIHAHEWERGGPITLRCWCGALVDAEARPPHVADELRPAS